MGVRGAALASALSTMAAFAGLLVVFVRDGGAPAPRPPPAARELGAMLRFGLPSGLNWFFEFAAFAFFVNVVVAGLGTTALAALMAVMQVNSVAFMPAFAHRERRRDHRRPGDRRGAKDEVPGRVGLTLAVAGTWQALVASRTCIAPELVLSAFAPTARAAGDFLAAGRADADDLRGVAALRRRRDRPRRDAARRRGHRVHALGAARPGVGGLVAGELDLGAAARRRRHRGGGVVRLLPLRAGADAAPALPERGVAEDRS